MNAPVAPVRLQPDFAQRPIPEAFLQALAQRFGAQCSTASVSYTHLTLPTTPYV